MTADTALYTHTIEFPPFARTTPRIRREIQSKRQRIVSARESAFLHPLEIDVPG